MWCGEVAFDCSSRWAILQDVSFISSMRSSSSVSTEGIVDPLIAMANSLKPPDSSQLLIPLFWSISFLANCCPGGYNKFDAQLRLDTLDAPGVLVSSWALVACTHSL